MSKSTKRAIQIATQPGRAVRQRLQQRTVRLITPGRDTLAPTLERRRQGEVIFDRELPITDDLGNKTSRTGWRATSPIERYRSRNQITADQAAVLILFREAMGMAGLEARAVSALSMGGAGGSTDGFSVHRLDALTSVREARALLTQPQFDLLVWVAHQDEDAGTWIGVSRYHKDRASRMAMDMLRTIADIMGNKWG